MDLQARVRSEQMDYGLFEAAADAATWLHETAPAPARLRVVGDDDADGASSAHVLATALRRAGYEVDAHLQPVHGPADLERALQGRYDAWLLADMGSAFLRELDARGQSVLLLDHHAVHDYKPRHVFELNPRRVGGNHTWGVSASVVSGVFALAVDTANWDLAPAAAVGAVADRQHLGGFHGLGAFLVDGSAQRGHFDCDEGLTLDGPTVAAALAGSLDPYFDGLSGDAAAATRFLGDHGIDAGADPLRLPKAQGRALADELEARLAQRGAAPERHYPLYGPRYRFPGGRIPTLFTLTRLLEAATAEHAFDLAMAVVADQQGAEDEATIVHRQRQTRVLTELANLRSRIQDQGAYRWVETNDAANTGLYAHTLLTYVLGDAKPLVVAADTPVGHKASARGSPRLFLGGLDLARALDRAASSCGGNGGGHPGAAGATIPHGRLPQFRHALHAALEELGGAA
jgi:single-stranded-DNA-specific exonuclease